MPLLRGREFLGLPAGGEERAPVISAGVDSDRLPLAGEADRLDRFRGTQELRLSLFL